MVLLLLFFWLYTQKSIAGSYSCSIFGFEKHSYCCPQWLYQYTFLPAVYKGFFFQILCNICFLCSFDDSLSDRCEWNLVVLIRISIIIVLACVCVLNHLSRVWVFTTPLTVPGQVTLSVGFSTQEYWSGLPFSSLGDLPNPGIEALSLMPPALAVVLYHWCHLGSHNNYPYISHL